MSHSKFADNQFLSATEKRFPLVGEILDDVVPKITAAASVHSEFVADRTAITALETTWNGLETDLFNLEAAHFSATFALKTALAALTRKPSSEENSPLESWDLTIRGSAPSGSTTYKYLLPHGRDTLTGGTINEQIEALHDLSVRLAEQTGKAPLVALATTVEAMHTTIDGLRTTQQDKEAAIITQRRTMETSRINIAAALYRMVGSAMVLWNTTPEKVDTLFDVNILRDPKRAIPTPPLDTTWTPAQRRLSTTALPDGATRLEAWRQGPGGAPEKLAVGSRRALEVMIPAEYTFDVGDPYQLWLTAANGEGSSAPGPKQNWVAV